MNYEKIVELLKTGAFVSALKFISPTERVNFKRKLSNGKLDKRDKSIDIILTVGKPNYAQKMLLKKYHGKFPSPWLTKAYQSKKKK